MSSETVSDIILDEHNMVIFADDPKWIGRIIDTECSYICLPYFDESLNVPYCYAIREKTYRIKRWKDLAKTD